MRIFLLSPFFAIIFVLFGFTSPSEKQVNSNDLFDACVNCGELFANSDIETLNNEKLKFESDNVKSDISSYSPVIDFVLPPDDSTKTLGIGTTDSTKTLGSGITDSTKTKKLTLADTLNMSPWGMDSTARLLYFNPERNDAPNLFFRPKKKSSFFVYPNTSKKRTAELDSSGQFVIIKEEISGMKTRPELRIPLDEYITLRQEGLNRDLWEDIGYKYEMKEAKKDLGQLLTDITNIDIPLPSVSFLSIFGPPKINLKINGAVDIHGAWKTEKTEGLTASNLGNSRSEPDFKQTVQIGVNGTIGDKLSIGADWNTERTFEYENMLKIKYTGYEDEMIQSVEAGNVSLQTSSLVGGSEALFGLKAQFKFGPLSLTALASQKKGEITEMSVSGGSSSTTFEIHAYDYSKNHFFVNEMYADTSKNGAFYKYYSPANPIVDPNIIINDIEVWKSYRQTDFPNNVRIANAIINIEAKNGNNYDEFRKKKEKPNVGDEVYTYKFQKLVKDVDYIYNENVGYISLLTGVAEDDVIAVAFKTAEGLSYGEFSSEQSDPNTVLVLSLVKPENLQSQFKKAWYLQLKNIYSLKGKDIKKEGFSLDIQYEISGQEPVSEYNGVKLLNAFGLDKYNDAKAETPDGKFDFYSGQTINPSTGEIIFPTLQPFGQNMDERFGKDLRYQSVYDTSYTVAKQDNTKDKFLIVGEYSASATSSYSIGFNVVENSVKVLLNGRELSKGSDYSVDYNTGQINILNDAALAPGADLRITYEQNDLFSLASKTLVGLRGLYEFSKRTKLGFSFLNLNQETLSEKVRIGEEPLNNSIYGIDFETGFDMPFLTKAIDKVFSTSAMSSFSFKGEFAYINPDPNTKKSTISSDDSKSIAYIDDFEGSKKIIPVGVSYTTWKDVSKPVNPLNDSLLLPIQNKAKAFWYNILPSDVKVTEIWPEKQVSRNDQQVTALDFVFRPNQKGSFNYNPDLGMLTNNWGGMMKGLSSSARNLLDENIEYIEFWVKIIDAPVGAKLNIDLGQISEDVSDNDELDTEDKNENGLLDEGEDTGYDKALDFAEPNYSSDNPDPSGDNFYFQNTQINNPEYFQNINGTEGNGKLTDLGRIPDTEDLNGNNTFDPVNSYFNYVVPLDTSRENNPFIAGGGGDRDWYLIQIPLKDVTKSVGNPQLTIINSIRLWVTDVASEVHFRVAEFNLVGNQWQKVLTKEVTKDDEVLTLSTINIEDNPEYSSPPGVFREKDKSNTEETVLANEQSLLMRFDGLKDGDKREIVKYLGRELNVFNYKEMKLFVHGDMNDMNGSISHYESDSSYASEVYFRFGTDSSNFYEYRQPVKADWNEIAIEFDKLTSIKQSRTRTDTLVQIDVEGLTGHKYGIKGNPTLTRVKYFTFGVINPIDKGEQLQSISGDLWVNELRVLDADNTPGWAYSGSTSMRFADLLTVSVNTSKTNPNFHKLSERFGNRIDRNSWGIAADLDVLKILPINLPGSNLRVTYSHTETVDKPLYSPGTDVNVEEAAKLIEQNLLAKNAPADSAKAVAERFKTETQTISVSDSWNISNVKFKIPSESWYIRDIINPLTLSFNYNKQFSRSPTILLSKSWTWNSTASHQVNLSNNYFFYPAKLPLIGDFLELFSDYRNIKIYYTPQSITSSMGMNRRQSYSESRTANTSPNIQRDFTSTRSAGFNWKMTEGGFLNLSTQYQISFASTYAHLLTDSSGYERPESQIWKDIFTSSLFGKDISFSQSLQFKFNPKLPALWNLNKYFTITTSYSTNYKWENSINQGDLGRRASFANQFSAGFTLRWKSLWEPLFQEEKSSNNNQQQNIQTQNKGRGRQRNIDNEIQNNVNNDFTESVANDSLNAATDSLNAVNKPSSLKKALAFLKSALKWILVDYDQFAVNFSHTNSFSSSGIAAEGTGFNNFWGYSQRNYQGPSRAFMLGFSYDVGPRAKNGNLTDAFSQKNSMDFKTSRPLWEGATLDVDWKVSWGMNKTTQITTDDEGRVTIGNVNSTGTIERSFFSMPPTFFLSVFKSGIKRVNELYNPNSADPAGDLSDAFVQGMESFSALSKIPILQQVAKYIPRPNWRLNWNGLEKFTFFKNFAKRVSLNHAYQSSYSEGWKLNTDGESEIQSQKIYYGFQPLVGLNMTFNSLWSGDFSGSVKFNTKTSYDLSATTRNITETFSRDISITASYKKSGFEIPLFGISLKNDIEFSFSYILGKNSVIKYDMDNFTEEGTPQDGTSRTSMEPRLKYVMSSKVSLSLFYKITTVEPEGASPIPATTTNTAGLDIHIAIQ